MKWTTPLETQKVTKLTQGKKKKMENQNRPTTSKETKLVIKASQLRNQNQVPHW